MSFQEFDAIAEQWAVYKRTPSPTMRFALPFVNSGDIILDAGCGTGNNARAFSERGAHVCAIDASSEMVRIAKNQLKGMHCVVKQANVRSLPFSEGYFDSVYALAVIHHLESEEARLIALREAFRVLRNGGVFFCTVWNKEQPRLCEYADDANVPWRLNGKKILRYYHFFNAIELRNLLIQSGFKSVETWYEKNGSVSQRNGGHNLVAVALK